MENSDLFDNYRQVYPDGKKDNHTFAGRLRKITKAIPDQVAFIQGDREVTWKEFDCKTNRLSNALLSLGIGREDRVMIMGFNSIQWMESFFAVSKIGAVPCNLNPRYVPIELKHVLEDSDSKALIFEEDYLESVRAVRKDLPLLKHLIVIGKNVPSDMLCYDDLLENHKDTSPNVSWDITNDDFSVLYYTGGTTGYPKGTVWDGYNRVRGFDALLLTAMRSLSMQIADLPSEVYPALLPMFSAHIGEKLIKNKVSKWLINKLTENPKSEEIMIKLCGTGILYRLMAGKIRLLAAAPLFHGAAFNSIFSTLSASGLVTAFLEKSHPFDPKHLWETVQRHKINSIIIVGDAFAIPMVEELEKNNYDISALSLIFSSGGRWSPGIKKRFLKMNPGMLLLDELGSTETNSAYAQVASKDDEEIGQLRIKIKPEGLNTTRVINPITHEDVRPGERGELIYGGFNSLGYWKDPEKTDKTFRVIDGKRWFYVGDEGTVDDEGNFSFIGRSSSIINTGGEKVFAEEVEDILSQHPGIRDCGVTGVADPKWGEAVTAVVVKEKDTPLQPDDVIQYCHGLMAGYKKPKNVIIVDTLPRAASAKLKRKDLKNLANETLQKGIEPEPG